MIDKVANSKIPNVEEAMNSLLWMFDKVAIFFKGGGYIRSMVANFSILERQWRRRNYNFILCEIHYLKIPTVEWSDLWLLIFQYWKRQWKRRPW